MALTLPYPNITFVPLDVLTADEMNHIVANYTFIANQFPLAASQITDGSIGGAKLSSGVIKVVTSDPGENVNWPDNNAILIAVV